MTMKRTGIFGGTFDPPTKAHVAIANAALENLSLDRVIFLPANQNPHKQETVPTPAEIRVEMLRAVVEVNDAFSIDLCEIERRGLSYTYDTLQYLSEKLKDSELYFIQGADSLISFPRWYKYEELLELATFVFFPRVGWDIEEVDKEILKKVTLFNNPHFDISSTMARNQIRDGKSVNDLVEGSVLNVIEKYKLYRK